MKDGIVEVCCDRPGCLRTLGAQRYENGKVVEEEFYLFAVKDGDNHYCSDCVEHKDEFRGPDEYISFD